jgi:hypothetical protein
VLALRDLQASFFRSIAASPGPKAAQRFDPALLEIVETPKVVGRRGRPGPADRLDIYAQMYWARLHDVLREDFPRVAAILGTERFRAVACAYLAENPSAHPSVRHVGDRFAEFLVGTSEAEELPFLADLARLEWVRLAVFDAPDARPLGAGDLRAVAAGDWPGLTLRLVPAVQFLESAWPVHELWTAAEEGLPEGVEPAETAVRVWRDGFMVYHASMDARERVALGRMVGGEPFAGVCSALESLTSGPEDAAREAAGLVLRWVEDGILAGFEYDSRSMRVPLAARTGA